MINLEEQFAEENADQYIGCISCKKSHHETSYCKCGRCYFKGKIDNSELGTFVTCKCGTVNWWD